VKDSIVLSSESTRNFSKGHVGTLIVSLGLWLVMLTLIPITVIATLLVVLVAAMLAAALAPTVIEALRPNDGYTGPDRRRAAR